MERPKTIIESPFAGNTERNLAYARACLRDSLSRGESPIASHLLYTQVLDYGIPSERELGMSAGLEWLPVADRHVFYTDLGISPGMRRALERAAELGRQVLFRKLPEWAEIAEG